MQYPITEYSGYAERNVINCIIVVSRERREERDSSMSQSVAQLPSFSIDGPHTVVKVFLVNGESRSLRLDERTDVNVSPPPPPPPPPPDLHHPRRSGRGRSELYTGTHCTADDRSAVGLVYMYCTEPWVCGVRPVMKAGRNEDCESGLHSLVVCEYVRPFHKNVACSRLVSQSQTLPGGRVRVWPHETSSGPCAMLTSLHLGWIVTVGEVSVT